MESVKRNSIRGFPLQFFDFISPRFCSSCEKKLEIDQKVLCDDCLSNLAHVNNELLNSEYIKKFASEKLIEEIFVPFNFIKEGTIQNLIHDLKYNSKFQSGIFLGELIFLNGIEVISKWKIDLIIPVPLHRLKKAERGYNQAEFIAKGIRRKSGIDLRTNSVERTRFTQSQTKLDLVDRRKNMEGAFIVKNKKSIKQKNILLVDDVMTTGATISECARVLKKFGANKIYAVSVGLA